MRKKSLNSVEVRLFRLDYEKVLKRLKEYADKIISKGAKVVVLIGSLTRGNYTAFSDADVIIVSDNVPENPMERLKDFLDPTLPIDLEPRVYTSKELFKMAREKRKIIGELIKYGKILAGDIKIVEKAKEKFLKQARPQQ